MFSRGKVLLDGESSHLESLLSDCQRHLSNGDEIPGCYLPLSGPPGASAMTLEPSAAVEHRDEGAYETVTGRFIHDASFFLSRALGNMSCTSSRNLRPRKPRASISPRRGWRDSAERPGSILLAALGIVGTGVATALLIYFRQSGKSTDSRGYYNLILTDSVAAATYSDEMGRGGSDVTVPAVGVPDVVGYSLCLLFYGGTGLANVMQGQRYWSECGFVMSLISVLVGCILGMGRMLDTLVVAGYLSLVLAKLIAFVADVNGYKTLLVPQ